MKKHLDIWLLGVLLVTGMLTHFISLDQPNQVIFDEVHFGKFVTAYCCTGERFFDIHPPHAKLLIAAAASVGGYTSVFSFDHISQTYEGVPIFWLRLVPALAGILLPLIIYVLMRQLGAKWPLAFLAGVALVFDNALVVQTRVIALDGVLLVATFGSLSAFLASEGRTGERRWLSIILSGGLAGLAVGTKFTGLSIVALIGIIVLVRIWQQWAKKNWREWIAVSLVLLFSATTVYLAGWAEHYILLPKPGFGDAFHQTNLTGAPLPIAFLRDVYELHQVMFSANYNLTATHPYASPWWNWPLMIRPVFYWQGMNNAVIYFIGNPAVWWGTFVLFITALSVLVIRFGWKKRYNKKQSSNIQIWIPILGYIIAMGPLVRVPRALFLYHYLTPLIFSLIIGLLWLQLEGFYKNGLRNRQKYIFGVVITLIIIVFLLFSPLTYGYTVSPAWRTNISWVKSWQ